MDPVVSGYARNNFESLVPNDVLSIIVLYFNQNVILKFKGDDLKLHRQWTVKRLKFNPDLYLEIGLSSTSMGLGPSFKSSLISECTVSWEITCIDTQSTIRMLHKWNHKDKRKPFGDKIVLQSKNKEELSFTFKVHSLKLVYNDKRRKHKQIKEPIYYPSFDAMKLTKVTQFEWKVNKNVIRKMKQCIDKMKFWSPVYNNWCIYYAPYKSKNSDLVLRLMSYPENIGKINIRCTVKTNFDETEQEYRGILQIGLTNQKFGIPLRKNVLSRKMIKDKLSFDVIVVIRNLYDLNDQEIPMESWHEHNVNLWS